MKVLTTTMILAFLFASCKKEEEPKPIENVEQGTYTECNKNYGTNSIRYRVVTITDTLYKQSTLNINTESNDTQTSVIQFKYDVLRSDTGLVISLIRPGFSSINYKYTNVASGKVNINYVDFCK
jgi:hypothetical protein